MQQENSHADSHWGGTMTCVECGRGFPAGEMIQFGEYWVCANCKPVFQQKLAEGSFRPHKFEYAGVGRRFLAVMLDGLILWFAFFLVGIASFAILGRGSVSQGLAGLGGLAGSGLSLVITASYMIFFIGNMGATPGKMAMGIKVVRANGASLGIPLGAGRYLATYLSSLTIGIGYLIAFFDDERKTLHDRVCGTRVIRT
ncbi:MAG: RDD family protein [Fibrobacteria bacterium]